MEQFQRAQQYVARNREDFGEERYESLQVMVLCLRHHVNEKIALSVALSW